jgi:hypothetical protein
MTRRALFRLTVAAVALACAAVALWPRPTHPAIALRAAHGAIAVTNSREGRAILAAGNLRPGQSVAGSVAVTNTGRAPARLLLRSSLPRAARGPYGGRLGDVLRVRLDDRVRARTVAAGRLADLAGCHDLGRLAPGATRTYALTATFPRGGRRDNVYARASVSVDERWTASAADCAGRVPATPKPPPEPEPQPQRRPRLEVLISHRRVLVRRGRTRLRLICLGTGRGRCRGSLQLRATGLESRLQRAAAGGTRFSARADGTDTIWVPLPRASQRRMRRRGKAVALAIVRPAAGSPLAPARRLITLIARHGSR